MVSQPPPDTSRAKPAESWSGEERLVRGAILLVASHGAPRVLVAGMVHGELMLDRLRAPALEAGVRLRARPTADDNHVDIVVEAIQ